MFPILVVGNQQAKMGLDLDLDKYLQSFNEQFGDFLKDLGHYQNDGEALYCGSKYLQRFIDALYEINKKIPDYKLPGNIGALHSLDGALVDIRAAKGKYASMGDEEKAAAAIKIASGYGFGTAGKLRNAVQAIATSVNSTVRKQKK